MVKERPIIFSSEMIRAILDSRKSQTRRVIKPLKRENSIITRPAAEKYHAINAWGGGAWRKGSRIETIPCPYGIPGDRLWVKETWCNPQYPKLIFPSFTLYKANYSEQNLQSMKAKIRNGWKLSIHMPQWASRITLEIVDVRVERVQDAGPRESSREGIPSRDYAGCRTNTQINKDAVEDFREYWDSIYAKKGFGWSQNPFVWALTFKLIGR